LWAVELAGAIDVQRFQKIVVCVADFNIRINVCIRAPDYGVLGRDEVGDALVVSSFLKRPLDVETQRIYLAGRLPGDTDRLSLRGGLEGTGDQVNGGESRFRGHGQEKNKHGKQPNAAQEGPSRGH
jgi:hypothetical protein